MLDRRISGWILAIALLTVVATVTPMLRVDGPGPAPHSSMRGQTVMLYGHGPYRHMPADVAVQGLAQDLVTLVLGVPLLLGTWIRTRRGTPPPHLALTGIVAYLFVQYTLYLAMATYNELFLVWVGLVLCTFQVLVRLLLAYPASRFTPAEHHAGSRRFVGGFLLVNGTLITLLWLSVVVPPLLDGTLYPAGLGHLTTMVVQGFDLALFLPPSLLAGWWYWRGAALGDLLAPVYTVFLSLQMTALLAKILWMRAVGVSAGPALVLIPLLLVGAIAASWIALRALTSGHCRAGLQ
jgi:hypothetical protein